MTNKYRKTEDEYLLDIEDHDKLLIIDDILSKAEKFNEFDYNFVSSIHDELLDKGKIHRDQYNALVNIYYGFGMQNILNDI
jgi:hypothetical protein